ncbi:4'-phosphopantetheinyl transferase superfamily protein [Streptomyces physcomitrii]|uniref:4'-phosphopantetheinyl transferase family protein n=1 Tax=Streptomyces physcomitrii TaxID=2724184 RepID=UPI0033D4FEB0
MTLTRAPLPAPGTYRLWIFDSLTQEGIPATRAEAGPEALGPEERRRARLFRRPADRRQYESAHLVLRRLLADHTGLAPERLEFGREGGRRGKPRLLGSPVPVHFSLSHSHGLVAIALAADPVGVDVQRVPGARTVERCLPSLHPAERAELTALPESERPDAFALLWTRKEAYLKGLGTGLARPLAADYLGSGGLAARPPDWTVHNTAARPGHAAAAALRVPATG